MSSDRMWALTYDRETDPWETTAGMRSTEVERPTIDETTDYSRPRQVLIRPLATPASAAATAASGSAARSAT